MSYYDTLDEDVQRAKEILAKGRAELPQEFYTVLSPEERARMQRSAGGTIYGADTYAAYQLLASFIAHIEQSRRNATERLNNFVDALSCCDVCGGPPCETDTEPNIACAKCWTRLTDAAKDNERLAALVEDLKRWNAATASAVRSLTEGNTE